MNYCVRVWWLVISLHAEFFSFGTNDLTRNTWAIARRLQQLFAEHQKIGLVKEISFAVLDTAGVGRFDQMACSAGRGTRSDLNIGICGEHGGDLSIMFAHVGQTTSSCSPLYQLHVWLLLMPPFKCQMSKSQRLGKCLVMLFFVAHACGRKIYCFCSIPNHETIDCLNQMFRKALYSVASE